MDNLSDLWGILKDRNIMSSSSERGGGGHPANAGAHNNYIEFED